MTTSSVMRQASDDEESRALDEAAAWFARLHSGAVTSVDREDWVQWRMARSANQAAWARIEAVRSRFASLPASLAAPALLNAGSTRRSLLRGVALLAVTGACGERALRALPLAAWNADLRTAVGERREVVLDDGSRLQLDTDSAVDLRFDATQRRLRLHAGAILVRTAADARGRPFFVDTPQGSLRALGTRFVVRLEPASTQLTVLEHAVEVRSMQAPQLAQIVPAGRTLRFNATTMDGVTRAQAAASSWADGSIVAVDMPLGQLVAELARYRCGHLGCDAAVAQLVVSGAFPLDDTDRALAALLRSFPLELRQRSSYWLTLAPRSAPTA